jgi:beta-lactamase class A
VNVRSTFVLRLIAVVFIAAAVLITIVQLTGYSRQRYNYPTGMTIAGVPVGGLSPSEASARVLQIYSLPVEVHYADTIIHIDPIVAGFEIDIESMIAAADLQRTGGPFWNGFWDYLWNREPPTAQIPLRASIDEERLKIYLKEEIASRYDQPATEPQPIPGSTSFTPGQPGMELDIQRAIGPIVEAMRSPDRRVVVLAAQRTISSRPALRNLEILLKQLIAISEYDGVIGVYMLDLQSGQEIHFALDAGNPVTVQPDVAFTASSTMKIPVMVSYFINKQGGKPLDEDTYNAMLDMIKISLNPPADAFMKALDVTYGPLQVTTDMQKAGLENTFIAGYFEPGSQLIRIIETPSNLRKDVFTNPDIYNQTTPSDMGSLLADLYQCSETGGGALVAAFPGQINQQSCLQMIDLLAQDKIGVLFQAGIPEGTRIAHKHGWAGVAELGDGFTDISDAAIIYTPGGNYVLTVYSYHPKQAIWDLVAPLFAQISEAVYNYYNLPSQ